MRNKSITIYFTLLFTLLSMFFYIALDITPSYYTNDDIFLKQIASGEMTGTPNAHLLHIGFLTGSLLKLLYTILPCIPWYGILLFFYFSISLITTFHIFIRLFQKISYKLVFTGLYLFVSISFLWIHMIQIQYTTITAILCAASLVHFYLSPDIHVPKLYIKQNIISILFFLLSIELRNKACLMFLPTFLLIGIVKLLRNKAMFVSIFTYGSILLSVLLLTSVIEHIAYSDETWKNFKAYNTAREQVMDYNGFPDYDEYSEQYNALGVDHASYISASSRYQLLLDENINTEFMKAMAEISYQPNKNLVSVWNHFWERHVTSYTDRPLNLIVYILYFFIALLILFQRKWDVLFDCFALFTGRMIIWAYLLIINRPPTRVTQGIYIVEFLLLIAILLKNNLWCTSTTKKIYIPCITIIFITCCIFSCIKWGIPYMKSTNNVSRSKTQYASNYHELLTFFNNNEDNLYLLDTNSFSYFLESIFQRTNDTAHNTILMGSWTANSPWSNSIIRDFDISSLETAVMNNENIFFVFLDSEPTNYTYLQYFFESRHPQYSLEPTTTLTTNGNLQFTVLQLKHTK